MNIFSGLVKFGKIMKLIKGMAKSADESTLRERFKNTLEYADSLRQLSLNEKWQNGEKAGGGAESLAILTEGLALMQMSMVDPDRVLAEIKNIRQAKCSHGYSASVKAVAECGSEALDMAHVIALASLSHFQEARNVLDSLGVLNKFGFRENCESPFEREAKRKKVKEKNSEMIMKLEAVISWKEGHLSDFLEKQVEIQGMNALRESMSPKKHSGFPWKEFHDVIAREMTRLETGGPSVQYPTGQAGAFREAETLDMDVRPGKSKSRPRV